MSTHPMSLWQYHLDPPTQLINALAVWLQIPDARLLIADADGYESPAIEEDQIRRGVLKEAVARVLSGLWSLV